MDLFTFLTTTTEGKNLSVAGVLLLVFFSFMYLAMQYFKSRKDDQANTKVMLANQSSLTTTIQTMTNVNQSVAEHISENTHATSRLAEVIDKSIAQVSEGNATLVSFRDQLVLDRTLIEAKLSKIPDEVAAVVKDMFDQHNTAVDQSLLREVQKFIKQEGNKFRIGIMVLSPVGDILTVNDDILELIGATPDIIGKNIIKDDVLRIVGSDGTPLIAENSPFYYALSNVSSVNNILIGVFNNISQDFSWFLLKINPINAFGSVSISHYQVALTNIGEIVKVSQKNAVLTE